MGGCHWQCPGKGSRLDQDGRLPGKGQPEPGRDDRSADNETTCDVARMTERSGAATAPSATDLLPGAPHGRPAILHGLPAIWLRGNCQCADCLDSGSGQRLVGITDLPADVVV